MDRDSRQAKMWSAMAASMFAPKTTEYGQGVYYTDSDEETGENTYATLLSRLRVLGQDCRFFQVGGDSKGRAEGVSAIFHGSAKAAVTLEKASIEEGYELTPGCVDELPEDFWDTFNGVKLDEETAPEAFMELSYYGTLLHAAALSQSPKVLIAASKLAPAAAFALLDAYDQSVLHAAATTCSVEAVEAVIQRNRSALLQRSHKGELPLHVATRTLLGPNQEGGDVRLLLLEQTPKVLLPQVTVSGGNLLHYLAMDPRCPVEHMERFLAAMPASATAVYDNSGLSPLTRAVTSNMDLPALRLLAAATPAEVLLHSKDPRLRPFDLAMSLASGQKLSRVLRAIVEEYADRDLFSDLRLDKNRTPLHAAVMSFNPSIVKCICFLPQVKTWAGLEDDDGFIPLELAMQNCSASSLQKMMILVHNTHSRDLLRRMKNEERMTPLHVAVELDLYDIAEHIMERLPPEGFLLKNDDGHTPLYAGIFERDLLHEDNVVLFSKLSERHPGPPLTVAQWRAFGFPCSVTIVKKMVSSSGAEFFASTAKETWENGFTPLHASIYPFSEHSLTREWGEESSYGPRFRALLSLLPTWMAEVSDRFGRTPIYKAVQANNEDAVKALLDISSAYAITRIADRCNDERVSAIELAVMRQQVGMVRMIAAKAPPGVLNATTASGKPLPDLVHAMTMSLVVDNFGREIPLQEVKANLLDALAPRVKSACG